MIKEFNTLLEGKFENRIQAFSNPAKYAYIRVTHVKINNGMFYGEQAYNYQLDKPYRQFVLHPILEGEQIRIINYELKGKENFLGFKNLDKINKSMLILKDGCDVIVEKISHNTFKGGIQGCNCIVNWKGRDTYLQNQMELTKDFYYVIDRGMCSQNHHQLWGSKYGRFEFARMPL
jgi:CpeT protein